MCLRWITGSREKDKKIELNWWIASKKLKSCKLWIVLKRLKWCKGWNTWGQDRHPWATLTFFWNISSAIDMTHVILGIINCLNGLHIMIHLIDEILNSYHLLWLPRQYFTIWWALTWRDFVTLALWSNLLSGSFPTTAFLHPRVLMVIIRPLLQLSAVPNETLRNTNCIFSFN